MSSFNNNNQVTQQDRLHYLLNRLIMHSATEEELGELTALVNQAEPETVMRETESFLQAGSGQPAFAYNREKWQEAAAQILAADKAHNARQPGGRIRFLRHWWAVASVILLLATGAYLWLQNNPGQLLTGNKYQVGPTEIGPGKEGAVLTLADGRQIILDSLGNGVIASQAGTQVLLQDGRLTYDPTGTGYATAYNTMTTPKGRQFNVTLPDGTRVWLNAASSLRYPTVFSGTERRVEVRGEAYFEVARNAKQPFRVNVNDQAEVEVLGTDFNINAYADEASIKTTVLEGSVKVYKNADQAVLKSGQQARIDVPASGRQPSSKTGAAISVVNVSDANLDKVIAWKKGIFNFEGASLDDVMRQLERWYDIEVIYEKGIPHIEFGGEMSRNVNLSDLLRVLQASEVNFRMEAERKLIVYP